jgi:hypothetical protein
LITEVIARIEATGRFEAANDFGVGTAVLFAKLSPRLRHSFEFACAISKRMPAFRRIVLGAAKPLPAST